jgi:hypothetical protein
MERGVLVQRSMGPRLIIVGSVDADDPAQVRFTEHDDVVQALPADRANESLNVSVLPGDRGAIGRSRMPIALKRRTKTDPYVSLSETYALKY